MIRDSRVRRWFGGIVLVIAFAMLVLGQTALKDRLQGLGFLIYWLLCMVLTSVAIIIAFLDVRALAQRTREEQEQLFASTLSRVEKAVREKQELKDLGLGTQHPDGNKNPPCKQRR